MNNQIVQNQIEELKEIINNTNSTINNANNKISELEKQLEKVKDTYWTPKNEEDYYFINNLGGVNDICWKNDIFDKYRLSIGNIYKTQEEAEKIGSQKVFEQQLFTKLRRFADENNESQIDWNNSKQAKYYIGYSYDKKLIYIDYHYCCKEFQQDIYFTSNEMAEKAIEEFKDDLIKYFEEV